VGRISGKPPYVPPTFKSIGVDRLQHALTDSEKKKALKYGILTTVLNDYTGKFNILQGVNTLQDNANLFNAKGQSYSIQFMRIVAQINKELIVNATLDLLGQENGVNANTLTAGAVKDWTSIENESNKISKQIEELDTMMENSTKSLQSINEKNRAIQSEINELTNKQAQLVADKNAENQKIDYKNKSEKREIEFKIETAKREILNHNKSIENLEKSKENSNASQVQNQKSATSQKYEVLLTNTNFGYNVNSRDFFVKVERGKVENQYPTEQMMKIKAYIQNQQQS
jgi:hypothetical protein